MGEESMENHNLQQRRNRGSNFSKEEELMLVLEIEKHKNIIECKASDKIKTAEKVCVLYNIYLMYCVLF